MAYRLLAVLALIMVLGCGDSTRCTERDISSWVPATVEFGTPIFCESKMIGYRLDIDASDGTSRVWEMVQTDTPDRSNKVYVSADIDLLTPAERSVRIEQGSAVLMNTVGTNTRVEASAVAGTGAGKLLRAIRVIVPPGLRYRGEIRAVDWR